MDKVYNTCYDYFLLESLGLRYYEVQKKFRPSTSTEEVSFLCWSALSLIYMARTASTLFKNILF